MDESAVAVTLPVGKGPTEDEFPNGPGEGVEALPPGPVPRKPKPPPLVLSVRIGAVGRRAVPVRDVPVKFNMEGDDTVKLEPLEGPPVPPMLVLDVGSGESPEEEPTINPVLPKLLPAVGVLRFAMLYK